VSRRDSTLRARSRLEVEVIEQESAPSMANPLLVAVVEGGPHHVEGGATCCTVNRVHHSPFGRRQPLQLRTSFLPDWAEAKVAKRKAARWQDRPGGNWSPRTPLRLSARLAAAWPATPLLVGMRRRPEQLRALGRPLRQVRAAGAVGLAGEVAGRARACYCNPGGPSLAGMACKPPLNAGGPAALAQAAPQWGAPVPVVVGFLGAVSNRQLQELLLGAGLFGRGAAVTRVLAALRKAHTRQRGKASGWRSQERDLELDRDWNFELEIGTLSLLK